MKYALAIMIGATFVLLVATLTLVGMPYLQLSSEPVPAALEPYSAQELRGRQVYIANGCIYCHSQQPRDPGFSSADAERGWGRAAVPGDYSYDQPHLMGTMRTGPDLLNIGARQPSADWHMMHLYDPAAVVPGSIMPPHRFLFRVVDEADEGTTVVTMPEGYGPVAGQIVATEEAEALVAYLLSLDRTYPVSVAQPASDRTSDGEDQER